MSKLTLKKQRFVDEYVLDLNATQAAIRTGYSAKTARQIGQRLLTNVDIQEAIAAAQEQLRERTLVTQEDVIKGLLLEAQTNGEGSSQSARVTAWAHLGKHLGMFKDKVELSGSLEVKSARELTDDELAAIATRSGN